MSYLDALVACPNGFKAVITEMHEKGYGAYLRYEDGLPVGLFWKISQFHPSVDLITPSLDYLRGPVEDMTFLASIPWDNATVLALSNDVYGDVFADPDAFAMYRTYHDWLPWLDVDGNETIVDTGIVNPLYGTLKAIGAFA